MQLTKCILLKFAPIMPAFCSLLLPSYFSKNYSGKIGASLAIASVTRAINALYIKIGWLKCALNRESNLTVIAIMYQIIQYDVIKDHVSYTQSHTCAHCDVNS